MPWRLSFSRTAPREARAAAAAAKDLPTAPRADASLVPSPAVERLLAGVTRDALEPLVAEFSGETPAVIGGSPYTFKTRSSSSGRPIDMAEQYVYERLQRYGLDSASYQDFPGESGAPPGRNVIGQIRGTTKAGEIVVLGAHIDDQPWAGAAPGADDDASGVAATLVLVRAFAGHKFARTGRYSPGPSTCS